MAPRNKETEQEVLNWIAAVIGEPLPAGNYEDVLRDGVVLCNLINKIAPGSVKKIQTKGTNFQLMENIQRFQAAVKKYGVPEEEIFQTADLFERRNIPQVTLSLYALARITQKHPEYTGPSMGPKMADKNERTFTEEQLRAHEGELNLQMGYNKGASQSGQGSFGNTRHIFQAAVKKYGVPEEEIFQTADLFERRNIPQVTLSLYALARITQKHPEYTGPSMGPKMADKNERTFTEEQLRAHEGELNLQMGYNKGASQSGQGSFGNTRHM